MRRKGLRDKRNNFNFDIYKENINLFNNYINYYKNLIDEINNKISKIDNDIYLFGAHIFSQHLIVNGLNTRNIKYILDNDPKKQGNRLYGTHLKVMTPKILENKKNPYLIIKAGVYTNEIKADIINNINSNTIFIE